MKISHMFSAHVNEKYYIYNDNMPRFANKTFENIILKGMYYDGIFVIPAKKVTCTIFHHASYLCYN